MRLIRILLAVLAAVLLVAPSVATAATARPFKAEFTGQASFVPTQVPGVFSGTVSGAGRASHLGKVTVSTTETVDFRTSDGSILVRDGRMVMVAANGDELHWAYSGTGSAPDANGDTALTGTFVVTGGTGRFSDATGSGTFEGVASLVTALGSVSYRGTITY